MGWVGSLKALLQKVGDSTSVANTRNFVGRINRSEASTEAQSEFVKGDRFVPERTYFSVRVAEMRLSEAGRYGLEFVPMCSCFLRFTYGSSQRNVPFIIGNELISAGLGRDLAKTAAARITFNDLYVVRNVPVKA